MSKTSGANGAHAHVHDASHGSVKSYVVGMLLSLVLTFASFGVVMTHVVPRSMGLAAVVVLCVVQLVVQLRYFLHLGSSADQRSNTGIFVCTALLIAIIVAGSLWVIHNANVNMMPTQISVERALARD
ncbi:cytochrome o ubiquinol oxidase subunit IV [Paraburkholderia sp. C35]|uniref:cytochrome o ubiquinol oxidase subunit IV n=1 Tax=Paraburkholderia sp. C35 TaxID=2126993 RepID=UPI000D69E9F8|nr:cytochrome o ubiquinol oxidase subunit IV [Paraburkholderia sp. C35]